MPDDLQRCDQTGIMGWPRSGTTAAEVDVRDMLCAQAIQVVSQAARTLPPGSELDVVCNAADVYQDLLLWAKARAYPVLSTEAYAENMKLRIRPCPSRNG